MQSLDHLEIRDKLWADYYRRKQNHVCNRCGAFGEYAINKTISYPKVLGYPDQKKFYYITYSITENRIEIANSLGNEEFYGICKRCQDHITGKKQYPLKENLADVEATILELRDQEKSRRHQQQPAFEEFKHKALLEHRWKQEEELEEVVNKQKQQQRQQEKQKKERVEKK